MTYLSWLYKHNYNGVICKTTDWNYHPDLSTKTHLLSIEVSHTLPIKSAMTISKHKNPFEKSLGQIHAEQNMKHQYLNTWIINLIEITNYNFINLQCALENWDSRYPNYLVYGLQCSDQHNVVKLIGSVLRLYGTLKKYMISCRCWTPQFKYRIRAKLK